MSREVEQDDALAGQRLVGGDVATVGSDKGLSVQELHFIEKSERLKIEKQTFDEKEIKNRYQPQLAVKNIRQLQTRGVSLLSLKCDKLQQTGRARNLAAAVVILIVVNI